MQPHLFRIFLLGGVFACADEKVLDKMPQVLLVSFFAMCLIFSSVDSSRWKVNGVLFVGMTVALLNKLLLFG